MNGDPTWAVYRTQFKIAEHDAVYEHREQIRCDEPIFCADKCGAYVAAHRLMQDHVAHETYGAIHEVYTVRPTYLCPRCIARRERDARNRIG